MQWECSLELVNLYDVAEQLKQLNTLLKVINSESFCYGLKYVEENPAWLVSQYEKNSCLLSASLGLLHEIQETVAIVQKNVEDGVAI